MLSKNNMIQLTDQEIHLWQIKPKEINQSEELFALLSQSEKEKVARYRLDTAKHTALITRAFIRLILSKYASVDPQQWQFSISELGKPEIQDAPIPLRFNLSHNDELIICAICLEKDIGCDIENLSRKISVNAIAERFFSTQEAQLIKSSPTKFFQYWTLKEAFVKATGLGISQGLETFSFEVKDAETEKFNDNICLTFSENCQQTSPQNWYQALMFPDNKHCIAVSVNNKKQTEIKPTIRLFSTQQSASLFGH